MHTVTTTGVWRTNKQKAFIQSRSFFSKVYVLGCCRPAAVPSSFASFTYIAGIGTSKANIKYHLSKMTFLILLKWHKGVTGHGFIFVFVNIHYMFERLNNNTVIVRSEYSSEIFCCLFFLVFGHSSWSAVSLHIYHHTLWAVLKKHLGKSATFVDLNWQTHSFAHFPSEQKNQFPLIKS